jgi:hypothetical protein
MLKPRPSLRDNLETLCGAIDDGALDVGLPKQADTTLRFV